jgi:hypothetical protein
MQNVVGHRILRLINTSLSVSVPASYAREQGLRPGDHVVLMRDEDDAALKLKFIRTQPAADREAEA